ncbi:hypothetical protein [Lacinutrix sp.]|uniref:SecDF P1 head subdomain-containing protein n=1 Tax=Lacinutrix sp. TaxID=1937692 RepID=UPI0025BCA1AA|nr:hypothetical protein [Lacinutrix sp.]
MKKIKAVFTVVILLGVFSCQKPLEHQFIYAFENPDEATVENTSKIVEVLESRLSYYGLKNSVSLFEDNKILIKAYSNTLKDEALNNVVTNKGKLEFWETFNSIKIARDIFELEDYKENGSAASKILKASSGTGFEGYPILLYMKPKDTLNVIKTLDSLKQKLFGPQKFVKFLYGRPSKDGALSIYTIKSNRENKAVMSGSVIEKAQQKKDFANRPVVSITMNQEGALEWERLTEKAYNENRQIAMVINDVVFSAPGVSNGPIKGGRSEISGDFTVQEAAELAAILLGKEEIPQLKLMTYTKQPQ